MPVVSSSYALEPHTQVDGRRYVTEKHVLSAGEPVVITYLAAVGADYQSIMTQRVQQIDEMLAAEEAERLLGA